MPRFAMSTTFVPFVAALALAGAAQTHAAVVFSDSFEDGDVSDWTVSSSSNIHNPVVTVRTDSVHAGVGALWTYFDANVDNQGAGYVRASHTFNAAAAGDYQLDVWARSSPCQGCTMSFEVLLDDVLMVHDGSSPIDFKFNSFSLLGLASGVHTLTLGMHTDAAFSGRFNATFDDVVISNDAPADLPEPATWALAAGAFAAALAGRRRRV